MSREDTLDTRYGEFIDMLNCRAIESGAATQKIAKKMDIWDFLSLE